MKLTWNTETTFFTAAIFWGSLGPKRVFGLHGRYRTILIGFAAGFLIVICTFLLPWPSSTVLTPTVAWVLKKLFPRSKLVRNFHPVAIVSGARAFAPGNMSFYIPAFYIVLFSWGWLKNRYLAFWSRYNYVLITAFNTAIAISGLIMFFGLEIPGAEIDWWGNSSDTGCANYAGCPRLKIPKKGYIGPEKGHFN